MGSNAKRHQAVLSAIGTGKEDGVSDADSRLGMLRMLTDASTHVNLISEIRQKILHNLPEVFLVDS
jgi:hypothetical protein